MRKNTWNMFHIFYILKFLQQTRRIQVSGNFSIIIAHIHCQEKWNYPTVNPWPKQIIPNMNSRANTTGKFYLKEGSLWQYFPPNVFNPTPYAVIHPGFPTSGVDENRAELHYEQKRSPGEDDDADLSERSRFSFSCHVTRATNRATWKKSADRERELSWF